MGVKLGRSFRKRRKKRVATAVIGTLSSVCQGPRNVARTYETRHGSRRIQMRSRLRSKTATFKPQTLIYDGVKLSLEYKQRYKGRATKKTSENSLILLCFSDEVNNYNKQLSKTRNKKLNIH
jgi:hypothetical protein